MTSQRSSSIIALSVLVFLVAGCGSGSDFPVGSYEMEHNGTQWLMQFNDDGTWVGIYDGQVDAPEAAGTYTTDDDELTFETDDGCRAETGKATYTWIAEGDDLTFVVVGSDLCGGRLSLLDNVTYSVVNE